MNKKSNLRKLLDWEDEVIFNPNTDEKEKDSIEHCKTSYYTDYKYNIFYEVGKSYTFPNKNLISNTYYAVSIIF